MKLVTMVALALALVASPACGDDGGPTLVLADGTSVSRVDLTVVDTIPVDFDDMAGNAPEGAEVSLEPMTSDEAYANAQQHLACASVDVAASFIEIESLVVGPGATVLNYQVDVARRGSGQWVFLAEFDGSVTAGDVIHFDHQRVVVADAGQSALSEILLSADPALDVRILAEVPAAVDDLQVGLSLAMVFSSDPGTCP